MKDVRMKFIPGDTVYEYDTAEQGEVKGLEVLQVIMNKGTKIEYYLEGGRTRTQDQLLTERQALYLAIQYHERESESFRSRRAELWKTEEIQTLDDDELAEKERERFNNEQSDEGWMRERVPDEH